MSEKMENLPAGATLAPAHIDGQMTGASIVHHDMTTTDQLPSKPVLSVRSIMQDIARKSREAGVLQQPVLAPEATPAPEPATKPEYNPHHKQKESSVKQRQSEVEKQEAKDEEKMAPNMSLQSRSMQIESRVKPLAPVGPKADREITKKSSIPQRALDAPQHYNMDRAARVAAAEARLGIKADKDPEPVAVPKA